MHNPHLHLREGRRSRERVNLIILSLLFSTSLPIFCSFSH